MIASDVWHHSLCVCWQNILPTHMRSSPRVARLIKKISLICSFSVYQVFVWVGSGANETEKKEALSTALV
jgi:hypothetical protein